ncbi:DUF2905 domain-containing protein [Marinobacteraceae bacterium S3BR75-40.1]
MSRMLIIIGVVIVLIGVLWPWLSKLPIGQLPGDIIVRKGNTTFYFPVTTMILASLVLSLLFWLFGR